MHKNNCDCFLFLFMYEAGGHSRDDVLALIEKKYQGNADVQIDRHIFLSGSQVLRNCTGCIWCKEQRISGELLLLHAYPESDCLRWFMSESAKSLSSCAECLESYYSVRPKLSAEFARFYQGHTLQIFWSKVAESDAQRIQASLANFLNGRNGAKDMSLLYALYELLLYPRHLALSSLKDDFGQVLCRLVDARKMIKVTRLLPGILTCLFDKNASVREWAVSVLNDPCLERIPAFIEDSLNFAAISEHADTPYFVESLLLLSKWLPEKSANVDLRVCFDLLLQFCDGGHFDKFFDASMSLAKRTKFVISSLNWQDLFKIFFSSDKFSFFFASALLLPSDEPVWISVVKHSVAQGVDPSLILCLIDRLSGCLSTVHSVTVANNVCVIALHLDLPSLLPKNIQAVFRFVAGCASLLPMLDASCSDVKTKFVQLCWNLDAIFWRSKSDHEFRGFSQLIGQMLSDKSRPSPMLELVFRELAELMPEDLIQFSQQRPNISKILHENSTIDMVGKSDAFAALFVLFHACHPGNGSERLREAMVSFPERLIRGVENVVSLIITDGRLRDESFKNLFTGLLATFNQSFQSKFFINRDQTVVDFFSDSVSLKNVILSTTLIICMVGCRSFEIPERPLALNLVHAISFGGRLLNQITATTASSNLKRLNVDTVILSRLLEFSCKLLSVDRDLQKDFVSIMTFIVEIATIHAHRFSVTSIKLLEVTLSSLACDFGSKKKLNECFDAYERKTRVLLPRPPADAPRPEPQKRKLEKDIVPVDVEQKVYIKLQSAEEKRKERQLPIALRSNIIPILPKPASKVEQLKAELTKESASSLVGPARKKIALPTLRKPQHLDRHASSASEDEGEVSDLLAIKNRFDAQSNSNTGAGARSVKLIDIADSKVTTKTGSEKAPYGTSIQEVNFFQQFHRQILHFDLKRLETMTDEAVSVVPATFDSSAQYISVFKPLLFMECRAQLSHSLEETGNEPVSFLRICDVAHVDDFHELTLANNDADTEADANRYRLSDQDYLMLEFSGQGDVLPAVVIQSGLKGGVFEAVIRLSIPTEKAALQIELREGLRLAYRKIGNVVTNLREYLALQSVGGLSLAPIIFNPTMTSTQPLGVIPDLAGISRALDINASQAKAISAVVQGLNPITLIQGPPGTGKTKTIEALLGVLVGRTSSQGTKPGRVMICAPSNAAIDEIVRRIKTGLISGTGHRLHAKVLRVGAYEMISEHVKELTLESQVDALLSASTASSNNLLASQKKSCEDLRKNLMAAERAGQDDRIRSLKTALWEAKENMRKNVKFIEDTRMTLRQKILNEAQIVCCTLASAGHEILTRIDFDHVIIDEACQAVELSCLVPLQHNCRQCVLVGGTPMDDISWTKAV